MSMTAETEESKAEVVRWYTRARRFPQLIGKTASGGQIWGGPYTYTQVAVGAISLVVGLKTTWVWGRFGTIGNAVVVLGVSYGLVFLTGRLPVGARNPFAVGAGLLRALSAPSQGRLNGSPLRLRRPHRARSRVVIAPATSTVPIVLVPDGRRVPRAAKAARASRRRQREEGQRPAAPPQLRPTPATSRRSATPALTGVQRLLASAATSREED